MGSFVALTASAWSSPPIVDDAKFLATMAKELGTMAAAHQATNGPTLAKASKAAPASIAVEFPEEVPKSVRYDTLAKSIYILGSVGKCSKCPQWHIGVAATAWCLTSDGVMVTNHHVLAEATGAAWGVCGVDGKVFRVLDVLATDAAADVAIFRVDAKNLCPLTLGTQPEVGAPVSIISHPDGRFFFRSSGEVARYFMAPSPPIGKIITWMSVTADFARGSSGGPVIDANGAVVGMVSRTQSIYYNAPHNNGKETTSDMQQGPLQMVVKNCVPTSALRAITQADTPRKPQSNPNPELETTN